MPITASCGSCGKTYQAPDRLAGKSVRCKSCGEVFRIDSAEGGEVDLDALEHSVSGEHLPTHAGTAMGTRAMRSPEGDEDMTVAGGPRVDADGRISVERGGDADAFDFRSAGGAGFRSNYRYRYPGAKVVDQLLPFAIVILTIALLASACLSTGATAGEAPTTGVGVSRLLILLAAYVFIVWPASHVAMTMASTRMRFSMPKAAAWRSFAGFMPVLMMGGWLFVKSGGGAMPLVLGLILGTALAVGAVTLLFRLFANEVPTASGYAAGGALGGSAFAALAIVAINMIGVVIARMDSKPTLFESPIAIGLPWVEKPADAPTVARRTVPAEAPTTTSAALESVATTTRPAEGSSVAGLNVATALPTMSTPKPEEGEPQLVRLVEVTPVRAGFDEVVVPPVASTAVAIVRHAAGGVVECWDRSTWKQPVPQVGRNFVRDQGALVVNTISRMVVRLVHTPTHRVEQIPLGNTRAMSPITFGSTRNRALVGFVTENELLVRIDEDGTVAFERYDLGAGGKAIDGPRQLKNLGEKRAQAVRVAPARTTVRLVPDGSGILVACRDPNDPREPARLSLYGWEDFDAPTSFGDVQVGTSGPLLPLGMAVRPSGRVALLLDAGGEAYLTTWDLGRADADVRQTTSKQPTLDGKVGILQSLRGGDWNDDCDPLLWIDDHTVLIYGRVLIDAESGLRLGAIGLTGIVAQYSAGDGAVLLVQREGGPASLLRVTLDGAALKAARPK